MPGSLLFQFENNTWVARIANTEVVYTIAGDTADDQIQIIRGIADLMEEGIRGAAYNDMFVNVPEGVLMDDVLFAPVNMISVEAIAGATAGGSWGVRGTFSSILSDLEEAGEALLAML
jgi:hypothetical protein